MMNRMPGLNQNGIAHLFALIFLAAAVILGIFLVQTKTNIFPRAANDIASPKTAFTLGSGTQQIGPGGEFYIKVGASSDFDAANLFTASINYPKDKVQVLDISPSPEATGSGDTFIKKWIEQTDDKNGTITLSGAVPNPGFKTEAGQTYTMATIRFKSLINSGEIPFAVNADSAIYRNSDNQNIIGNNTGVTVKIGTAPSSSPSALPLPSDSRRVFRTRDIFNQNLGGLNGADLKCQTAANNEKLGGTWKAWLSSEGVSATSRLEHATVPYKLLDGTVIASNWADLVDGSLQNPIIVNERIQSNPIGYDVWTGTSNTGESNTVCNSWDYVTNPQTFWTLVGNSASAQLWTNSGKYRSCTDSTIYLPLYCFEQSTSTPSQPPSPTRYNLEARPSANIQFPVSSTNTGYGIGVTLKESGNVVADQSDFNFTWSLGDGTVVKSEPWASNSTTDCGFGIKPPCPRIQSNLTGLKAGTTYLKVEAIKRSTNQKVAEVVFNITVTPAPSPSGAPPTVDGQRADLYKDANKPNFVNDQDISVFFTKCAEKGVELFGQPSSVQPICDINNDGFINAPDWAIIIKYRNKPTI